jgi:signal transduction histidine kinase
VSTRVFQRLARRIGNAAQAMENIPEVSRRLTVAIALARNEFHECVRISVQDAGEGIAAENLTRIFVHGFTTRKSGHGFGLHSSALAAREMGGRLIVHSDGLGHGAVFTVELPMGSGAPAP